MAQYNGLSTKEAKERLKKYGKNALKEEKPKTIFKMIMENLINWTNLILGFAIVLLFWLQDYSELFIILFIIVANLIVSVVMENTSQKTVEALKKLSSFKAYVFRDGEKIEIDAENLVVGDYVSLEAGQQVPADIKLLETANLKIDEKILTGESVPVEKDSDAVIENDNVPLGDRVNEAFMSTVVTYGRGVGVVEKTGMDTQIGTIATLVGKEKNISSPLQVAMDQLSKILGIAVIAICIIVFIVGMFQDRNMLEMALISVSLAVAAIPEGIPTIITIILALGMKQMAKLNAIVKTLPSVETLGSVSYVCSDKTGTLTQNKMTVVKAFRDLEYMDLETCDIKSNDLFINGFLLCNDANITADGVEIGDPTETALVSLAKRYGLSKMEQENIYPRINEKAFDSDRKLMSTVHTMDIDNVSKIVSFTKGSTDELLTRCKKILVNGKVRDITSDDMSKISNAMVEMSNEALRVLSLAIKYDNKDAIEQDLIYVGMVGMIDPERPEVIETIKVFKGAGIKTVMITGDHKDTALAIAKKLGIASKSSECIMGNELEKLTDEELKDRVRDISIFARVSPEHKVRIVKALQANGNIVSMTGDGVNDAPSLKAANVGVAMGITGTDVAKGAANIILQDDLFTTIGKAVRKGREIFENAKKSIIFALSSNFSEVITMFVAIVVGLATPLKASHILWVNLLTDSLPCFALGVDTNSSFDVMKRPPRKENESIFANGGFKLVLFYGCLISITTLLGFVLNPILYLMNNGIDISLVKIISTYAMEDILIKSQTYAFSVLAISELFHAFGMRDINTSIFKFKWFDNKLMIVAFAVGILGQLAVTEIPILTNLFGTVGLGLKDWGIILVLSILPLIAHEIIVLAKRIKK